MTLYGASGCMSIQLKHSEKQSYLDLPPIEKCEYQGLEPKYAEEIRIQEGFTRITGYRKYGRLLFTGSNKAEYVLLIPMNNRIYDKSIWRNPSRAKGAAPQNNPVEVVYNPPLRKGIASMMVLLPPGTWRDYPTRIVLYNEKDEKRIYIAYRNGPDKDDICWSIADATDYNLKSGKVVESVSVPILPMAAVSAVAYSRRARSSRSDPHSYYYSVAFSPDGKYALSGSYDNAVKVWDIASGEKIRAFTGHEGAVESVAISADGSRVLSGSRDKTIKLWDFISGVLINTFTGHNDDVKSIAISPDGSRLLSGSWDDTLRLWDISSASELQVFAKTGGTYHYGSSSFNAVAVSPDGRYALSGNCRSEIHLWDIESGNTLKTFMGHKDTYVNSVAFSPNSQYALSGGNDGTMKLWEVASGWEIGSFRQNSGYVYSVKFSPDGRYGLSGNANGLLLLWELSTGKLIRIFERHNDRVSSVAFSPDGRFILSGSDDETLKLWDRKSGKEIRTFKARPEKTASK